VSAFVFSLLTGCILLADALIMPGVVAVLGLGSVLLGNAVTAVAMAAFIRWSHRAGRYRGAVTT
jgi:hypothetical protein